MIPKYLSIQGFKSFSKKETIDFDKIPEGLILITGRNEVEQNLEGNGVGKSSIFEALTWCLFGKTSTNLKAGDIVNWNGKNKCMVEFGFLLDDISYTLIRTQNPNSLTLNRTTISQEELEKVLKLNLKSFIYSIFISQFGDKFIDLQPSDKMAVFTDILDDILNKWTTYSDNAKNKRDKEFDEIHSLETKIKYFQGRIQGLDISSLEEKKKLWSKEQEERKNELLKKIVSYEPVGGLDSDINKLEEELKFLEDKIDNSIEKQDSITIQSSNTETRIHILEDRIEELESLGSVCSKCGQEIANDLFDKDITNLRENILNLNEEKTKLDESSEKIRKRTLKMMNERDEVLKEIEEEKERRTLRRNSLERISELKEELDRIKNEENPYSSLIEQNIKEQKETNISLSSSEKLLELTKRRYEAFKYLVKAFKDIKLMLTSEALDELEIIINNNLQKLGLSNDWKVKLDVMEETKSKTIKKGFTVLIESPFNKSLVPFECWSGGEGQRLRLSISLGLSDFIKTRRGIDWNWIILDEPSQFLSQTGIIQMVSSLKEKADNDFMKIFIIDHRKLPIFGEFSSNIEVIKTTDGSKIYA